MTITIEKPFEGRLVLCVISTSVPREQWDDVLEVESIALGINGNEEEVEVVWPDVRYLANAASMQLMFRMRVEALRRLAESAVAGVPCEVRIGKVHADVSAEHGREILDLLTGVKSVKSEDGRK